MKNKKMSLMLVKNGLAETAEKTLNEQHSPGKIGIFFANLRNNENERAQIVKYLEKNIGAADISSYFEDTFEELKNNVGYICAKIILMDTYNNFMFKFSEQHNITPKEVVSVLVSTIDDICLMSSTLLEFDDVPDGVYQIAYRCAITDTYGSFFGEVSYGVGVEVNEKGELHFFDRYVFDRAMSVIVFEYMEIIRNNIVIKKCENCGSFFIPTTRKDEKYCDNIFRDNKSCKQLGYEIKVNSDDILKTYRKIYKTQNARKQRNKNNCKNIEAKFKTWSNYAKTELERCKQGEIDLNTFERNIDKTDWLRGE